MQSLIVENRSMSMPRFDDADQHFVRNSLFLFMKNRCILFQNHEDSRHSNRKNNPPMNVNNSNNNLTSTRVATIKSAKRDQKPPLNVKRSLRINPSVLISFCTLEYPQILQSSAKRHRRNSALILLHCTHQSIVDIHTK